jgi:hypothetical protein
MEDLCHFDLHEGLKTPKIDAIPHRMGRGPWSLYVQGIEGVAFGRTLTTLEDDNIWSFAPRHWPLEA